MSLMKYGYYYEDPNLTLDDIKLIEMEMGRLDIFYIKYKNLIDKTGDI